jgi:hypothetical protein
LISKKSSPLKPLGQMTVSEEQVSKKSSNQKQELPVADMFVNGSKLNEPDL